MDPWIRTRYSKTASTQTYIHGTIHNNHDDFLKTHAGFNVGTLDLFPIDWSKVKMGVVGDGRRVVESIQIPILGLRLAAETTQSHYTGNSNKNTRQSHRFSSSGCCSWYHCCHGTKCVCCSSKKRVCLLVVDVEKEELGKSFDRKPPPSQW